MKVISTKVHGVMDHLVSAILIAAPWIFDFYRGGAESWVPVALGAGSILYSLVTDYELSIAKTLSMRTHLTLDVLSGIFLAASPWIFGFNDHVYLPHVIFGIVAIGTASMTEPTPRHTYTTSQNVH